MGKISNNSTTDPPFLHQFQHCPWQKTLVITHTLGKHQIQ